MINIIQASLLDKKEFNHACLLITGQAGDLGCFKCPSCAKPYIYWMPPGTRTTSNALSPLVHYGLELN